MTFKTIINSIVQLGRGGPKLKANAGHFEARNPADTAMAEMWGVDGTDVASLITLGKLFTTAEINLYVDDVTGNDANVGTSASPLKTITAARNKLPYFINHVCRIFVADHSGVGYTWPMFGPHALTKNIYVHGGWMLWNGSAWIEDPVHTGKDVVIASTVALAGSDSFHVVTMGLTVDAYAGATIEVLDGECAGDRRTIRDNTATTITPDEIFSATFNPGDHYRVFWPTVKIDTGTKRVLANSVGTPKPWIIGAASLAIGLVLVNLRIVYSSIATEFRSDDSCIIFAGCYFDFDFYPVVQGDTTYYSGFDGFSETTYFSTMSCGLELSAPSSTSWVGWGCGFGYGLQIQTPFGFMGYIVTVGKLHVDFGLAILWGGRIKKTEINGSEQDSGGPPCGVRLSGYYNKFLIKSDNSYGLLVLSAKVNLYGVEMKNVLNGIEATGTMALVRVADTSGNASNIGMITRDGAVIKAETPPTLTGTAGDFSENGGTTKRLNATLTNGASFVDVSTLSKIYRRDY